MCIRDRNECYESIFLFTIMCRRNNWAGLDKDVYKRQMQAGFVELPGKTVYYGQDGKMLYEEQTIEGSNYYFDPVTGKRLEGKWRGKTYYDEKGRQVYLSLIHISISEIAEALEEEEDTIRRMVEEMADHPGKCVGRNRTGSFAEERCGKR